MDQHDDNSSGEAKRRDVLVAAGKHAVAVPAASLLLAASAKQSMASPYGGGGNSGGNGKGNGKGNGGGGPSNGHRPIVPPGRS